MKTLLRTILVLSAATAAAFAQGWEFGGSGGGSFLNTVSVSSPAGSATAGFKPGAVVGGFVGFSQYKHIGGELRYTFFQSNLSLKAGGVEAPSFSGQAHAIQYDVIFKTAKNSSKVQLFAAVGGGMKVFRGTGTPSAYINVASTYGYFTQTQELKPMGSVGGGARFSLSRKVFLRTEIRDYITAFPQKIIAPPTGFKYGSILHDIVPMVTLGFDM
jgi:hypothetical protein